MSDMKDIYLIRWLDPRTMPDSSPEDPISLFEWRSVGWLEQDDEVVSLVTSRGEDGTIDRLIIPASLIRERTKLNG